MWLACYTQEEIGKQESVDHKTASNVLGTMAELPNFPKPEQTAAQHSGEDFDPPIYNIWKQQEKSSGSKHVHQSHTITHLSQSLKS